MESHRSRRTKDQARKAWYAHYRQVRFARWFGFIEEDANLDRVFSIYQHRTPQTSPNACPFSEPHLTASC